MAGRTTQIEPRGTKSERETFKEVDHHRNKARQDLEQRLRRFDKADELFRAHINVDAQWPYNAEVFDPRVFTAIFEKTSRMFARKPRGRMVPREGGDALGAMINNELLSFQWDDVDRTMDLPMLARWAQLDMNARKYGAGFALVKWKWERHLKKDPASTKSKKKDEPMYKSVPYYDGPDFVPLINRDCLPNPAYSTIKNWFQYRDYVTWQELKNTNDAARTGPKYRNLDILRQQIERLGSGFSTVGGDRRDTNYQSRNKSIVGIQDQIGDDPVFKTIEVITEYRNNRWISFAPKHGVILRDVENPYDHGQIPIVTLKYYPIDDDIYGLSEIEPVQRLQRAINALINQYLDAVNMSLYTPLKVRATGVKMHTLEFGPGKKWIMNDPSSDVIPHDQSPTGVSEFTSTYSFMISAMQSALGETSQGISNLSPFEAQKTATEVRSSNLQRLTRDNFNQIFLSEAMKKQMMFWHLMNRQFLFDNNEGKLKVIRITGKEAIRYFQRRGLDGMDLPEGAEEQIQAASEEGVDIDPRDLQVPIFGIEDRGDTLPKFNVEEGGEMGMLIITPEDLAGTYDYIPDTESMQIPNDEQLNEERQQAMALALNPAMTQALGQEGFSIKTKELFEDILENAGLKDAEKYFEKGGVNAQALQAGAVTPGAGGPQPGPEAGGTFQEQGLAGGAQAVVGGQAQPVVPGSFPV